MSGETGDRRSTTDQGHVQAGTVPSAPSGKARGGAASADPAPGDAENGATESDAIPLAELVVEATAAEAGQLGAADDVTAATGKPGESKPKTDADDAGADQAGGDNTAAASAGVSDTADAAGAPAATPAPAPMPQAVAAAIEVFAGVTPATASGDGATPIDPASALQAVEQKGVVAKSDALPGGLKATPGKASATSLAPDGEPSNARLEPATAGAPTAKSEAGSDPQAGRASDGPDKGQPAPAHVEPGKPSHDSRYADAPTKLDGSAPTQSPNDSAGAVKVAADALAPLGAPGQIHSSSGSLAPAAQAGAAGLASPQPAVPLAGLAIEIATQAHGGKSHFEIRLDPPDLGRVDVRLHVHSDGSVTTRMIAERSDTLDLLKRDATGLERALQQAGLKTSDNALQFSLRQQQNFAGHQAPLANAAQLIVPDENATPIEAVRNGYGRLLGLGGGLDIRV